MRLKRDLILKTVLANELNSAANEDENLAIEEGYVPDGIADHHHVLNQTNLNDRSNSEFWSSFSSSEEALLNCAGTFFKHRKTKPINRPILRPINN